MGADLDLLCSDGGSVGCVFFQLSKDLDDHGRRSTWKQGWVGGCERQCLGKTDGQGRRGEREKERHRDRYRDRDRNTIQSINEDVLKKEAGWGLVE